MHLQGVLCARNTEYVYATATALCCSPSPATRHLSYIVVEENRMLYTVQEFRHLMHP